jgi:hypothetical protein
LLDTKFIHIAEHAQKKAKRKEKERKIPAAVHALESKPYSVCSAELPIWVVRGFWNRVEFPRNGVGRSPGELQRVEFLD